MRSNGLLKWLMIPVAILVLFVGIRLFSGGGSTAPPAADNGAQLTPDEMKALGIEGDTPRDTVDLVDRALLVEATEFIVRVVNNF